MEKMAMVIRDDSYDKLLTPLVFAYLAAGADETQVDMLFVNWAAKALTAEGAKALVVDGRHADQDGWLREQVAKAGLPNDIYEILKALKETGRVNMYVCSMAAQIFGVNEDNMIPEASDIVGANWFLNEKMAKADHCQYF